MGQHDVERYRKRLLGLAYRIVGNIADSEDAVQDAFVRWHRREGTAEPVESPEAWLVTVVTRLSIDRVRALKRERELYVGPWLPEPVSAHDASSPERNTEIAEDLSLAFLALLQQLSEDERAAVVLRNILGYSYEEVSRILQKTQEASRQLVHRGRRNLKSGTVKNHLAFKEKDRIVRTLLTAVENGDEPTMLQLLAPDVRWTADGGGKVPGVASKPVAGVDKVGSMLAGILRRASSISRIAVIELAGEPALAFWDDRTLYAVWTIDLDGGSIGSFNNVLNPDKLARLSKILK